MFFHRDIEKLILNQLSSTANEIILLSGARQTGKTTIVENIKTKKEKVIINFWDESPEINVLKNAASFDLFNKYLFQFFKFKPNGEKILIIDEAQSSKTLGKFLMQMHREWKGQNVILLGSILSNLCSDNTPMPVGRVIEFICRPLNFREFLRFKDKESYLELFDKNINTNTNIDDKLHNLLMQEYELFIQIGGLPGIVNAFNNNNDIELLFESLLNNFYRDADRFINKEDNNFKRRVAQYGSLMEHCMKSIGYHVSSPTTNSSILSTDSPVYRTIMPEVLESLKSWHIVYFIQNETKQYTTKKGYNSKKYLFDTGIMNYLINHMLPVSLQKPSEISAKLLENAVLQDLISAVHFLSKISSYKTNNKARNELDFAVKYNNKLVPVEVKSSIKINQKSISQLLEYLKHHNLNKGMVIYTGKPKLKQIDNFELIYVPPYYIPILFDTRLIQCQTLN